MQTKEFPSMTVLRILVVCVSVSTCAEPQADPVAQGDTPLHDLVHALVDLRPERSFDHPLSLEAAADLVEAAFRAAGVSPQRQSYEVQGTIVHNISVLLGDPKAARFIVGAHYDSVRGSPGADDNASGVAVLVELARRLRNDDLPASVELVAYTLEEPPFFRTPQMGSARHAARLLESGVPILGMLALDCLGLFSDEPDSQRMPPGLPANPAFSRGNFLAVVGRPEDSPLANKLVQALGDTVGPVFHPFLMPPSVEGVDFSDHLNFWPLGVPAVMVTDTAFLRNAHYHTADDRAADLDMAKLEQIAAQLATAVRGVVRDGL
jgi:Zn-dependent M28 family amino/carboxypeptidase